jgi:aspartyl protease family protein
MALSSGSRQAVTMAAGWMAAAGCAAVAILHFDRITGAAHGVMGREQPVTTQVRSDNRGGQGDRGRSNSGGRVVELRAGGYGHFHASAEINGRPVSVMVDTGASMVALTYEDARAAGLFVRDADFTHRVSTANGAARVAPVTIDRVSIGDITVRNVPGAVMESGKLGTTLLGMSFLSRLQRVDMRSGMLVLQE